MTAAEFSAMQSVGFEGQEKELVLIYSNVICNFYFSAFFLNLYNYYDQRLFLALKFSIVS